MPIYCDEAGYTGYNLLEKNQPYFVYAALNIEDEQANSFVDRMKAKYHLQGEPKGTNWIKSNKGRKAIIELFENHVENVRAVFYHKKYALSCKYFEYVFEPTITDSNSFFYRMKFHRFIANLVYVAFENSIEKAEDLFWSFQELLRGNNDTELFEFLHSKQTPNDLVSMIAEFTVIHRQTILEEITTNGQVDYWILDLAQTALHDLLRTWSTEIGPLKVIIDESQPLREAVANNPLYHELNAEIREWDPFGYGPSAINFSLKEAVKFGKSKNDPGLQMADLFASSIYWALNNPNDSLAQIIHSHRVAFIPSPNNCCIFPEPEMYLDANSVEFDFGVTALNRLLQFSKESPNGIGERFVEYLRNRVNEYKRLT